MPVEIRDIEAARELLAGVITRTPTLHDGRMSETINANAWVKAECLQKSGSFKIRGAYNKISRLSDEEKQRGVITASAGNHAQGVGLAAKLHGIRATIVLPEFAPLTKIMATRALGAEVIMHGQSFDEAVAYSRGLGEERGLTYVHAFDDDHVIAGQGTIGFEIAEDLPNANVIVVPIGGGGVCSGVAIAAKHLLPGVKVYGVQAKNVASMRVSIEAGEPIEVPHQSTIADGIAIKRPAERTLNIIREYVDEIVEVTEEEIAAAIYHLAQNTRLVVEGAGAAGAAALLAGRIKVASDDTVCSVLCGGNIDGNLLARVIEQVLVRNGRYIILRILVPDRPGSLAGMLKIVAEEHANVIEVYHQRAIWLAPLGSVGIEVILEVRDAEHGEQVHQRLTDAGYYAEHVKGDW